MYLSTRVLGIGIAKQLDERRVAPLLRIGADVFHRGDLSAVECFNFNAAATLSRAIAELHVKNTRDLYENVAPSALAVPNVGAIALAVLGAAFEQKHLGGDKPLEKWVSLHHTPNGIKREIVTFDTIKRHAADHEEADRKDRKHARRDQAHRLRVARFTKRAKAG